MSEMSQVAPLVFVVGGEITVRESLAIVIGIAGWEVETFASAYDFLARPRSLTPCCLILDVSLPGLDALDIQARIASERRDMPILFLTDRSDIITAVKAIKAGAFEFFLKPVEDDTLVSAVRQAVESSRAALAKAARLKVIHECYASLSRREREVMALVSSGLANKQVGAELGISEVTVKAHRGQVMQKMQANSFADLIRIGARLGLSRRVELPALRS
jgi:FixJ family two-component response regulator